MKLWQVVLTFIVLQIASAYLSDAIRHCEACKMGIGW